MFGLCLIIPTLGVFSSKYTISITSNRLSSFPKRALSLIKIVATRRAACTIDS